MADCVFDNPEHANGGCIFADPGVPLTDEQIVSIMKDIMQNIIYETCEC